MWTAIAVGFLGVVIALLSILNTMLMSVSERMIEFGVLRANAEFADSDRLAAGAAASVSIGELELVEVYRDAAITAADALARLPETLDAELRQLAMRLEVAQELCAGDGVRERLGLLGGSDQWPRLEISDADRDDTDCGPECYDIRVRHSIPPDALRRILTLYGQPCDDGGARRKLPVPLGMDMPPELRNAERLRFVHMGERARAAVVLQQRQPGLVEKLVDQAVSARDATTYRREAGIGNTLFQLLLPQELKATVRGAARSRPNSVRIIVAASSAMASGVMPSSAAIGVPLGYAFLWLIQTFWTFDPTVYYISRIPVHVLGSDVVLVAGSAILISFAATLYPSLQAAKLDPAAALRYE